MTHVVKLLLSVQLKQRLRTQFSPRVRPLVVHDLSADIASVLKLVLTARLSHEFRLQFSPGVTPSLPTQAP